MAPPEWLDAVRGVLQEAGVVGENLEEALGEIADLAEVTDTEVVGILMEAGLTELDAEAAAALIVAVAA